MEVELRTDLSAAKNAELLFERAKKLEEKARKARQALEEMKKKLEKLKKSIPEIREEELIKVKRAREWYEKFRWFFSSTGKLVIGGRDASTNELLIKKYVKPSSIVLHADIHGAPFFVIFGEADKKSIEEAAVAAACFSKAWKLGLGAIDVYWVKGEQVSKKAPSGEYLAKGAFMIYGKKNYIGKVELKLAVGVKGDKVTAGPVNAIKTWAERFVLITPGSLSQGRAAKEIAKLLNADVNEVQRALPAGGIEILKE